MNFKFCAAASLLAAAQKIFRIPTGFELSRNRQLSLLHKLCVGDYPDFIAQCNAPGFCKQSKAHSEIFAVKFSVQRKSNAGVAPWVLCDSAQLSVQNNLFACPAHGERAMHFVVFITNLLELVCFKNKLRMILSIEEIA